MAWPSDANSPTQNRCRQRAAELVAQQSQLLCRRTERLFAWLLVVQWIAAVAGAAWFGRPTGFSLLGEVVTAVLGGAVISGVPLLLIAYAPGKTITRHSVAVAQIVWASLLMELTVGRLGSHFPVFGALAILACFRDWRVLLTAVFVFVVREVIREDLWPLEFGGAIYEWERLAFIIFEMFALTIAIRVSARESWLLAIGQARLEENHRQLDADYKQRTAIYRDYTERLEQARDELHVQAEELQRARSAAEQANAAKSRLVATVSHEIRSPLTAILGYADVLLANLADAESLNSARTIQRNGKYLLRLVDDILDHSKIESGNMHVEIMPCVVRPMVHDVVQLMQVRADAKGLALVVEYGREVPEVIHSDPFRLRQILLNLVSNAIKFSSHGQVCVRVAREGRQHETAMVRFEVSDEGIGLTQRQLENLFQPFAQGDETTSRLYGGSGLGLWISKRLANLLGGDIEVHSAAGRGSNFVVTVATREPAQSGCAASTEPRDLEDVVNLSALGQPLAGRRILLADDSPDNLELVRFVLERSGGEVTTVRNGEDAVNVACAAVRVGEPFDLLLMDVQMPRLDGLSATQQLREQGFAGQIVALTAHARTAELERCLAAGCNDCLSKPIDASLVRRIVQWIGAEHHQASPA